MISFMTLAELDRWVLEAHWGETRRQSAARVPGAFCRAAIGSGSVRQVGRGNRRRSGVGRRIECGSCIAATALLTGAPLVTPTVTITSA